jgi:ethylmalonyl-CoA/methylmalonyl-CoA decarboxylase
VRAWLTHGTGSVVLGHCKRHRARTLTVENPSRHNAFSPTMMVQLREAVGQLEREVAEALPRWEDGESDAMLLAQGASYNLLVMTGSPGGSFCSGADLSLVRALVAEDRHPEEMVAFGNWMTDTMTDSLNRLSRLPVVSVSYLEGPALGGGAELATATDFRVMSPAARIQFVQARMGVSPGWGAAWRLREIVGPSMAVRLLTGGRALDASAAESVGLSDATVSPLQSQCSCGNATCPLASLPDRKSLSLPAPEVFPSVLAANKMAVLRPELEQAWFSRVWGRSHQRVLLQSLFARN